MTLTRPTLRGRITLLALALLLALSACEQPTVGPTPTPTRTPIIPTATPTATATATPTPTPTPTLPPGLILAAPPAAPNGWPALPAHLYFLREGRLMRWPVGGGNLEQIIPPQVDATENVLCYAIPLSERFILYLNGDRQFRTLDMATGSTTTLPTSGVARPDVSGDFALTPDEQTLVYIAWGLYPGSDPGLAAAPAEITNGTLFALNLAEPQALQTALGFCQSDASAGRNRPCGELLLSPDGSQIAFTEKQGLWISQLATGESRLLAAYTSNQQPTWEPRAWSSGGGWLLVEAQDSASSFFVVINTTTGETQELPDTRCSTDCSVEAAWGSQGVWVAVAYPDTGNGELYLAAPAVGQPLTLARQFGGRDVAFIAPRDPQELGDGRLAFTHRGCVACLHPEAGLYLLNADDTWTPVALIPNADGTALWTADGSAFLYLNAAGEPEELGLADGSRLWDVRAQLDRAQALYWAHPYTPGP